MKNKFKLKYLVIGILSVIITCTGLFFFYVNDYYHAEKIALDILEKDYVTEYDKYIYIDSESENNSAFLFYPGAKVEPEAYLPLMDKIKQEGYDCIIVKMPFNMAIFDVDRGEEIIEFYDDIDNWYMMGHSMGGAFASQFASEHSNIFDKLFLLGAYPYKEFSKDDTLTIYGEYNTNIKEKLAKDDLYYEIKGGNHAYFGNYGEQKGDKKADITRDEQQDQTVKAIVDFIDN